jgi:formate dehydrogenase gamma subunit
VQHWLLLTSFIVLVITGFALEYPETWITWITGNSESVRRMIHRVAAVVMMVTGVYHIVYLLALKEGRLWAYDMLPRWKDFQDLFQNFRHFVLNKGERPKFARFRYADKAEYWAVVWGTVIMGITGLMIWFKVGMFGFLPRWAIDIAIAIHFYEAILATLAIIVWHFYHVIFDPDVYPINWTFYDGRMSEELFKEEHEQAYEDMKAEEARIAEAASMEDGETDSTEEDKQN